MKVYAAELQDLRLEGFAEVVHQAINGARRFPTIAELREAYLAAAHRRASTDGLPSPELMKTPMPPDLKKQVAELFTRMDERAQEIEDAASTQTADGRS